MAIGQRNSHLSLLPLLVILIIQSAAAVNLLYTGCSTYGAGQNDILRANINTTFANITSQIKSSPSLRFATSEIEYSQTVYTLYECRRYLSDGECSACLAAAIAQIYESCTNQSGARVVYDECFLRYDRQSFYGEGSSNGYEWRCTNPSVKDVGFKNATDGMMGQLATAVPKMDGYSAAVTTKTAGGLKVYGAAECWPTLERAACESCLNVIVGNITICPPDRDGRSFDSGCFMRYSTQSFFPTNKTVDIAPFLKSDSSKNKKGLITGVIVGCFVFVMLVLILSFILIYRSKKTNRQGDIVEATKLQGPLNYHYKDLKAATRNFSEENKLGEGGFGEVYKGILKNKKVVAVKKLTIGVSNKVQSGFVAEVKLISNVHHRNLVRLLGCSSKGQNMLLVYEYMANTSLDRHLFGEKRGSLNWKQRFDIIVGMARGLAYLHDEFHARIIHRDVKTNNVLLDEGFQAKISDFGLARLIPDGETHLTTKFAGTLGYTAPEYAIHGKLSEKVDTYGYGVVVLEIVTGRKANDIKLAPVAQYLLEWAWKLYEEGNIFELVDNTLKEYDPDEMKKVIEIALLCTQSIVEGRPAMSEVVLMLVGKSTSIINPTRPMFLGATNNTHDENSSRMSANLM